MWAMTQHFIVLSGEAGAGKDSVADLLASKHGYNKVSLSDAMKEFCGRVFGFSREQLYGPSHMRNAPDPRWARPCSHCKGDGHVQPHARVVCPKCDGTGKINDNSPRRILQLLGDEWGRQLIHPDIWTMSVRSSLEALLQANTRIVINDARFDNDRTNLRDWLGAKLVDVRTPNKKKDDAAWRQHASELSRPNDEQIDYVINNAEQWPFPSLPTTVTKMLHDLYGGV